MKLADSTIREFTNELASSSPAPGGGSTAAVEASFGAGLLAMVCELTLGNKKYEEFYESVNDIKQAANDNKTRLLEIVDEDTQAFNMVSTAFALPKNTDEEKQLRRQAIQAGLKESCLPPLNVLQEAYDCLILGTKLINNYNTNTASDLGTAIASLRAAGQGAYLNVLINISSIKDEEFVLDVKKQADDYYQDILKLSKQMYETILKQLQS